MKLRQARYHNARVRVRVVRYKLPNEVHAHCVVRDIHGVKQVGRGPKCSLSYNAIVVPFMPVQYITFKPVVIRSGAEFKEIIGEPK